MTAKTAYFGQLPCKLIGFQYDLHTHTNADVRSVYIIDGPRLLGIGDERARRVPVR